MAKVDSTQPRLPRSDIPGDYKCVYPDCPFVADTASKRGQELVFRNHMAQMHGVYYEKAAKESDTSKLLAKYNRSKEELEAIPEISQLASWHCAVLAQHVVYGLPLGPLAKAAKHSADTILAVSKSPAARAYMEQVSNNLHDPIATTRNLLAAGAVHKLLAWEEAFQLAVEAKDYASVHKMVKEIGLHQVLDQPEKTGPTKIVLNMNMGDLATPTISSRFEIVKDADWKEDADDDAAEAS